MTTLSDTLGARGIQSGTLALPGQHVLRRAALAAIGLLAAALRFTNLSALGYGNHYYTAAVVAMLQSWHNFFFVAAEPGGSVSVDKPPVGFWLQTLSAKILGVSGFSVILPEIVAGLLSVFVVYHLVQRKFGAVAGLIAGLVLAITPVAVATDRNNTIDSTLILTLLLAAWAFIKATENARLRYLLLGAALVGVGFNIKMLEAYLPLPAFLALYFFGAPERLLPKIGKLSVAAVVLLVVSLSWATIVDLTPADRRPYVGSSGDNSELSLIVGYNGVERLLGMGGRGGLLSGLFGNRTGGQTRGGGLPPFGGQAPQRTDGNGGVPGRPGGNGFPGAPGGNGGFPGGPGGNGAPGGFFNTGTPGALRLFTAPLSNQMSWLLPFGLVSALVLALGARLRWPVAPKHQALVLWGGWLVTGGVFFSVAGFFHEYYLSMLAPPLAALVGIGVVELWRLRTRSGWLASVLLLAAGAITLWFQYRTASAFTNAVWWLPLMVGAFAVGAFLLVAAALRNAQGLARAGFACVVAALLLTPGIWSELTNLNASTNQTLPAAYSGGRPSFGPAGRGGAGTQLTGLQLNSSLLAFLEQNTQGTSYLMAVPSSMQGADYVIATGRPVLYLGGFDGQDQVETPQSLTALVASGQLRYVYLGGGGGPGRGAQTSVADWVTSHGSLVQGFDTQTQNQGAPDGTGPSGPATDGRGGFGGFGSLQIRLYDLKGAS